MRPAATKCCYLIWIGYIRRTEKQEPKMRSKMKKRFWKSEFDDSYTLWASLGPPPWKKRAWNIVNNRVCAQVSISSARDAPESWIYCKLQWFYKKNVLKKKSKKVKSNKTIVFYWSRCNSCSKPLCFYSKVARPPNRNNKQWALRVNGFTCAWWQSDTKSDDSYTKREVATVQGAQQ